MAILKKGDKAPKFELRDQFGEKVNSDDLSGKVLLSFHPLAFTSVCTDQMRELDNRYDELKERGITPLGISVDAHPSKGVWSLSMGNSKLRMLSDFNPIGQLAKDCGIFVEKAGISERANILIENGVVIYSRLYETGEIPSLDHVLEGIE